KLSGAISSRYDRREWPVVSVTCSIQRATVLMSPESTSCAAASCEARLDRSDTVLIIRVVSAAALAVVDGFREAIGPLLRHALDLVLGHAVTQQVAVASHHD